MSNLINMLLVLFASYGIVFFTWWIITLFCLHHASSTLKIQTHNAQDTAFIKCLKYAGISPQYTQDEVFNATGTDEN